jgi:hypothetical protein
MTATAFTLRALASGEIAGTAIVCPEARYCSVRGRGGDRLDRRFATPRDWRAIETELTSLPSGLLSSQSTIVRVLGGRDLDVQHLASEDIEAAPADLVNVLVAKLQSLLLEIATLRVRH